MPSACQVGHFMCMSRLPTHSCARACSSGAGRRCLLPPPLSRALNTQHPCFPGGWPFRGVQVPSYILPRVPVSTRPSGEVTRLGVGCVLVREGSLSLCLHALNRRLHIQTVCRFRAAHLCLDSLVSLDSASARSTALLRPQFWRLPALSLLLRSSLSLTPSPSLAQRRIAAPATLASAGALFAAALISFLPRPPSL